jgi:hypothetical protein
LQALYAADAVKQAFEELLYTPFLILASDDGDDDDDDDVDNEMDPMSYVRMYGTHHPILSKMVQDHDDKMRERLVEGIGSWAKGVHPETE